MIFNVAKKYPPKKNIIILNILFDYFLYITSNIIANIINDVIANNKYGSFVKNRHR